VAAGLAPGQAEGRLVAQALGPWLEQVRAGEGDVTLGPGMVLAPCPGGLQRDEGSGANHRPHVARAFDPARLHRGYEGLVRGIAQGPGDGAAAPFEGDQVDARRAPRGQHDVAADVVAAAAEADRLQLAALAP